MKQIPAASVTIALRIPGQWSHPRELVTRLPAGYRLTPDALILPDKTEIGFGALDADDQFAEIFRSSCRRPATADELATVDGYNVNACWSGPGGSLQAARTMMQAGAAIVQAGWGVHRQLRTRSWRRKLAGDRRRRWARRA